MKILCVMNPGPHGHDYGNDFLFAGFCEELGFENVFDWPEKANVHMRHTTDRDECMLDSDQAWPRKGHHLSDVASIVDAAFLMLGPDEQSRNHIRGAVLALPTSTPVFVVDYTDMGADYRGMYRGMYEHLAGRQVAGYFKREWRPGMSGVPCPLSYPAQKGITTNNVRQHKVFYHTTDHGSSSVGPGVTRHDIVRLLRERIDPQFLDLALYPSQSNRPTPEEYHAAMQQCTIAVSWNRGPGTPQWDCNRIWESFAHGMCVVSDAPPYSLPNVPIHGVDWFTASDVGSLVAQIEALVRQPALTKEVARNGFAWYQQHHTSRARARYVLAECGFKRGAE